MNLQYLNISLGLLAIAFLATVFFTAVFLPLLRKLKMHQPIYTEYLKEHAGKSGTPTMGGIAILSGSLLALLAYAIPLLVMGRGQEMILPLFVFGYAFLNACIGVFDDLCKILLRKKNQGLLAWQKYLLQLLVAAGYLILLTKWGAFSTVFTLPFFGTEFDLGIFGYVLALIILTGTVNSANLTDGLDGLLSSVTLPIVLFFIAFSIVFSDGAVLPLAPALFGALLGFLCFNHHPAKLFMGDTGSLYIGSLVVGMAFLIGEPILLVLLGGIYVIETLSVILQVFSAKLVRRGILKQRIFRMAPLHHHFQKCDLSENRIVLLFTLVSAIFALLAWFGV